MADRISLLWTREHPRVGDRELTLVDIGGREYTHFYDILENGVSILPAGTCVTGYAHTLGVYTTYGLFTGDIGKIGGFYQSDLLVLRPDGQDAVIS